MMRLSPGIPHRWDCLSEQRISKWHVGEEDPDAAWLM
jgi:hypothetical protein